MFLSDIIVYKTSYDHCYMRQVKRNFEDRSLLITTQRHGEQETL